MPTTALPMNLQEARAVLWLRNNPRPLGELLDEGFLDDTKLDWAARNAYDPRLKQAAALLLNLMTTKPPTPAHEPSLTPLPLNAQIPQDVARAMLWPFKPYRGQRMGQLVDTHRVTLRDLAYVIENAWDDRVRRAAAVLMALRLGQVVQEPLPSAGPLKVVSSGRSYAERMQTGFTLLEGSLLGALIGGLVVFVIWSLVARASSPPSTSLKGTLSTSTGIIALIIVIVLVAISVATSYALMNWADQRLQRSIRSYQKGQEGEERVVEAMRQSLDGTWTLFRNVVLPGKRSDIDAVLAGPPGVWALEIKTLSGEYRNLGEHWETRIGNKWKLLRHSPSQQAQNNAARLSSFFKADGIRQWVTPAVVWADRESTLTLENPMVAVWNLGRLPEELGNIWQNRAIPEQDLGRMVDKLTKLCVQASESNDQRNGGLRQ